MSYATQVLAKESQQGLTVTLTRTGSQPSAANGNDIPGKIVCQSSAAGGAEDTINLDEHYSLALYNLGETIKNGYAIIQPLKYVEEISCSCLGF